MQTLFVGDNAALVGEQNTPNFVVMGSNAEFISRAADVVYAGLGHSTIIEAGVTGTQPGGTVVLSNVAASSADLLMGYNVTAFAGAGHLVATWTSGAQDTLVTGTGTIDVLNNAAGAGISYTGGIATETHDRAGTHITTGAGGHVNLYATGPLS